MNKRLITPCWRIACLAILVVAFLLLANVPNAHASTYSNAVSHAKNDTCNPMGTDGNKTGGIPVTTSPVPGVENVNTGSTQQKWENIGEVKLMWSNVCNTNWVEFDPADPKTLDSKYNYLFLDLYTQGAGWTDMNCAIPGSSSITTCETSALNTGSVPAQAVATANMTYTVPVTPTGNTPATYEWTAYGKASQY